MVRTLVLSTLGLVLAAGIPFAYYTLPEYWNSAAEIVAPSTSSAAPARSVSDDSLSMARVPLPGITREGVSADRPPIEELSEVLRFDVSPGWVLSRWPRVSTGLGQIQLQGYRVPLVTGTAEDDLAGALTYYFDPHQRLQRIAFYGTTGSPQKILALVTRQFGFARHVLNDPALLLYEVAQPGGQPPRSTLRIESAEVVKMTDPFRRYKVSLVIERPDQRG